MKMIFFCSQAKPWLVKRFLFGHVWRIWHLGHGGCFVRYLGNLKNGISEWLNLLNANWNQQTDGPHRSDGTSLYTHWISKILWAQSFTSSSPCHTRIPEDSRVVKGPWTRGSRPIWDPDPCWSLVIPGDPTSTKIKTRRRWAHWMTSQWAHFSHFSHSDSGCFAKGPSSDSDRCRGIGTHRGTRPTGGGWMGIFLDMFRNPVVCVFTTVFTIEIPWHHTT